MTINKQLGAGIDLGSNTFRLLIADCSNRKPAVLIKKLATVRLASGLKNSGRLEHEAMQSGFGVLHDFRNVLERFRPCSIRVCGTEALRRAENSRIFLDRTAEILGSPVDIITGEEEAHLSLAGLFFSRKDSFSTPLLLVDVGGGSTELVLAESPAEYITAVSVPLGVVWLTEQFISDRKQSFERLDQLLRKTLTQALEKQRILQGAHQAAIISSGGSATSMAALHQGLAEYNEALVHGSVLQQTDLESLWSRLTAMPAEARNRLPCLQEGRGEILPAGIRIFHILLEILQKNRMQVSDTGLLEGILLSGLRCSPCC